MKVEVKPTERKEALKDYLDDRTEKAEITGNKITVKTEKPEKLARIPGIESFTVDGEEREGLGGKPIHKKAAVKIESREDASRAFLATLKGYTLYIIASERDWDIRALKRYNSEIVELKDEELVEMFEFEEFSLGDIDVSDEELLEIYRKFLT